VHPDLGRGVVKYADQGRYCARITDLGEGLGSHTADIRVLIIEKRKEGRDEAHIAPGASAPRRELPNLG
jgi:hypothetical protein